MVGQTLVSRNHHRTANSDNNAEHIGHDVESRGKGSSSPIKNPFKRKKRCSVSSVATKFLLLGFFFIGFSLLVDTITFGPQSETLENNSKNTSAASQEESKPNLRPAYLTDDGLEDESKSEEDASTVENAGFGDEEVTGQYEIPRTLIFTHYKNLLELDLLHGENTHTDHNDVAAVNDPNSLTPGQREELTLAMNVRHSIEIHNQTTDNEEEELKVLFWTDDDCIASLERTRPKLIPYFKAETEGMYKADICRGTALLEHGGFYLDVDVGVRHDLWKDLKPTTGFVTARVHQASNWVGRGFFQAILGASRHSPIMQRYLELFERHYDGSDIVKKGPLGVLLLYRAWDEFRAKDQVGVPTELYQELLYKENGVLDKGAVHKGILSPAPTWGKRRACHFVVAGVANHQENVEIRLPKDSGGLDLQIPVLSRIPGSRMCVSEMEDTDESHNTTTMIESIKWWERT